jgi:hypothetical protein
MKTNYNTAAMVLLRDYGFTVQGKYIIRKGIPGFTFDRVHGHCKSLFDAVERLCPIINEPDFIRRKIALERER